MISWVRRHGRRGAAADLAFYAPLVLLPFAWFALGACGDPATMLQTPDRSIGPIRVANYPDYTRYTDPNGGFNQCAANGQYRGGSGPGSEGATRAALEGQVNSAKSRLAYLKAQRDSCRNANPTQAEFDRQKGCNRALVSKLRVDVATLVLEDERRRAENALAEENYKCVQAEIDFRYSPCSPEAKSQREWEIKAAEDDISRAEAELGRFNACIKDRDRAIQAQQRPQIDPSSVIIMMQGIGRPRPSAGHGTGTHKE